MRMVPEAGAARRTNPSCCDGCPRGIDRSREYEVTFDNSGDTVRVSSYELVNAGINLRLDSALTSELLLYKEVYE